MMAQVKRLWQNQAGALLVLYIVLDWLPFVIMRVQGDIQDTPLRRAMALFALDAFLAWRIWRGGSISWAILVLINVVDLFSLMFLAIAPWSLSDYLFALLVAGQLALLLSPAIRHRLGPVRRRYAG